MTRRAVLALLLLGPPVSVAADDAPEAPLAPPQGETPRDHHHRANLRLGVSSGDLNGRPTICLEVVAIAALSVEGCGTGSGFLHQEDGQEIAHFRAKWVLHQRRVGGGVLRVQPSVGFAELEIGRDAPGFSFGELRDGATSTAGPEAALGVQWLQPLGEGFEALASLSAGSAWFPHAPELSSPKRELQPFVSFEVGAGW